MTETIYNMTVILPVGAPQVTQVSLPSDLSLEDAYKYVWKQKYLTFSDGTQVQMSCVVGIKLERIS